MERNHKAERDRNMKILSFLQKSEEIKHSNKAEAHVNAEKMVSKQMRKEKRQRKRQSKEE